MMINTLGRSTAAAIPASAATSQAITAESVKK